MIVRQPASQEPNSDEYDDDLITNVVMLSDWYHTGALQQYTGLKNVSNPGRIPNNILINGKGQFNDSKTGFATSTPIETFTLTAGKRYRFRIINTFSVVCPIEVIIDNHSMQIISMDGESVQPVTVDSFTITNGIYIFF